MSFNRVENAVEIVRVGDVDGDLMRVQFGRKRFELRSSGNKNNLRP